MKAVASIYFETLWRPILESSKLHIHRHGNLKYLVFISDFTKTHCTSIEKATILLLLKSKVYILRVIEEPQIKCEY